MKSTRVLDLSTHPDRVWVTQHPPKVGRIIIVLPQLDEAATSELTQRVIRALESDPVLVGMLTTESN